MVDAQEPQGRAIHKTIWRQPLLHFLLGAIAVFLLDAVRGGSGDPDTDLIYVSPVQIARLNSQWARSWDRPPNEVELEQLITDFVEEEVYNREARLLQLDVGDSVIRRYLRRKMELLTAGTIVVPDPDEEALLSYFQKNSAKYAGSPKFDFQQVYLGSAPTLDVIEELAAIRKGKMPESLPGQGGLEAEMINATQLDVSRLFGVSFYDALTELGAGDWQGPVRSTFGTHLVRITRRQPGAVPDFTEVRNDVVADWYAARLAELEDEAFQRLKAKYTVRVELPEG